MENIFSKKLLGLEDFFDLNKSLLDNRNPIFQQRAIVAFLGEKFHCDVAFWFNKELCFISGSLQGEKVKVRKSNHTAGLQNKFRYLSASIKAHSHSSTNNRIILAGCISDGENVFADIELIRAKFAFSEEEITQIELLSFYIALTLQKSRQILPINVPADQLHFLSKFNSLIHDAFSLQNLFDLVVEFIHATYHYSYIALYSVDPNLGFLVLSSFKSDTKSEYLNRQQPIPIGNGIIGLAAQKGIDLFVKDVSHDPNYFPIRGLSNIYFEASIPLRGKNQILGVLDIRSSKKEEINQFDLIALKIITESIAMTIQVIQTQEELRTYSNQFSAILDTTRIINSILDTEKLLEEVIALIHEEFGYPVVHLYSILPIQNQIAYHTGGGPRSKKSGYHSIISLKDPKGIIAHVARSGKTCLVNDVEHEPLYRPAKFLPEITKSELTVPLKFGDEILGVLDIQSDKLNAFNHHDQSLMEALASSLAITLRNSRLYESEKWRRRVAESFQHVASLLPTNIAIDHLFETILSELEALLPCDSAAIWLTNKYSALESNKSFRLVACHGVSKDALDETYSSSQQIQNFLSKVYDSRSPILRKPDDPYEPLGTVCKFPNDYSSISTPLLVNEEVMGVLTLAHRSPGRYGMEAISMTETFASYSAAAIQNTRLFSNAKEQALISTILLQVAEASHQENNLDELLTTLTRIIPLLAGVNGCIIFLLSDDASSLIMKSSYGILLPGDPQIDFDLALPGFKSLFENGNVQIINDPALDLGLPEESFPEINHQILLLPMASHNGMIGALLVSRTVEQTDHPLEDYEQQLIPLLQGISLQSAVAIENLIFNEIHQEEAYVTAVLLQVAEAVVSSTTLNDTLDAIVHLIPILVGIDECLIFIINEGEKKYQLEASTSGSKDQIHLFGSAPLLDLIATTNAQIRIPLSQSDINSLNWPLIPDRENLSTSNFNEDAYWLLGFPIAAIGEKLGILLAREKNVKSRFLEKRLEMMNGIAQQIALAIQNNRFQKEREKRLSLQREVQVAREIQQTFLPTHIPKIPGWEIDLRWQTAREVGGDFYDVIEKGKDRLFLVIADVSDKGIPAALYMTVARTLIRSHVEISYSPAEILQKVNSQLHKESQDGMFVTVALVMIDFITGATMYSHAGHNLPIHYHAVSSKLTKLPGGGIVLGVLPEIQLKDYSFQISPGDRLFLYTDGVTDTCSPMGLEYGEKRFTRTLRNSAPLDLMLAVDYIDREINNFRGSRPLDDDLTLLAIQRNAE